MGTYCQVSSAGGGKWSDDGTYTAPGAPSATDIKAILGDVSGGGTEDIGTVMVSYSNPDGSMTGIYFSGNPTDGYYAQVVTGQESEFGDMADSKDVGEIYEFSSEDLKGRGNDSPGFWGNLGKGFSQYGQLWGDMFSDAYKYLTPNVYRIGTGPANGRGGPPARSGRRAVWVDWDVMTLIMTGFDQKTPTAKNAKDMTTDKIDIDAIDAWSPTNTHSSVGPKDSTIYYYPWDSGVGYDSSFMKEGILGVYGPSGILRRN